MWPFTESTTIPEPLAELETRAGAARDPRAVLLAEFRCVEREQLNLAVNSDLHKNISVRTSAPVRCRENFSERDISLPGKRIFAGATNSCLPKSDLRELARLKWQRGKILEVLLVSEILPQVFISRPIPGAAGSRNFVATGKRIRRRQCRIARPGHGLFDKFLRLLHRGILKDRIAPAWVRIVERFEEACAPIDERHIPLSENSTAT